MDKMHMKVVVLLLLTLQQDSSAVGVFSLAGRIEPRIWDCFYMTMTGKLREKN
jgi:hypothetical protein